MSKKNLSDALNLVFYCEDIHKDISIKEYLKLLLTTLWKEGENFSGKRPLGNSAWDYKVYEILIRYKFIAGVLDEDGYIESFDEKKACDFMLKLIDAIFNGEKNEN